jgi:hypothetical protein
MMLDVAGAVVDDSASFEGVETIDCDISASSSLL